MTSLRSIAGLCVALSTFALSASAQAPAKEVFGPSTATLSPAIRVGDFLFMSGQLGRGDSIGTQTTAALNLIKGVVEKAGGTMSDIVKCTVFLVDVKEFQGMNAAYSEAFAAQRAAGQGPPARSTVAVAALVTPTAKVEIECLAVLPKK